MNIKPVKTAVLGCGMISNTYLPILTKKFKILEVIGCCDMDQELAQKTAKRYNLQNMTMSELLSSEMELVINLTPAAVHYETNKQLLNAGKHVYSEKMLASNLEEAQELIELADRKNLYLGAAPDTFLGSAAQTARYVVESGMIGEVTSCYAEATRDYLFFSNFIRNAMEPEGGIFKDYGIYSITVLLSILGSVKEVAGVMETRIPHGIYQDIERLGEPYTMKCESLVSASLIFESGVIGNILLDSNSLFTCPEKPMLVINGTKGILYMADPNCFSGEVKVLLKGNSDPFVMQQSHGFDEEYRGVGAAEMAWAIRGERKSRANKEMAYHAMEVIEGLQQSSETKRFYQLKSSFEKTAALPRGFRRMISSVDREENALI